MRLKDIDYKSLHPKQTISHFLGQNAITNKFELSRSLINLVTNANIDVDSFFPRCYDLNCFYDHANFLVDYKISECVLLLKTGVKDLYRQLREKSLKKENDAQNGLGEQEGEVTSDKDEDTMFDSLHSEKMEINIFRILVAMTCVIRYCDLLENKRNISEIIETHEFEFVRKTGQQIPESEWIKTNYLDYIDEAVYRVKDNVELNEEVNIFDVVSFGDHVNMDSKTMTEKKREVQSQQVIPNEAADPEKVIFSENNLISERVVPQKRIEMNEETDIAKLPNNFSKKSVEEVVEDQKSVETENQDPGNVSVEKDLEEAKSNQTPKTSLNGKEPSEAAPVSPEKESQPDALKANPQENKTSVLSDLLELVLKHALYVLARYKKLNPQYNLLDSQNLWIVKPNGLSRGRGIRVFRSLEEIEAYWVAADCEMVAMKYIENPLLIYKRKFDIRHWVVVTSMDPLTIWSFQDYYIRLSLTDYDEQDNQNIFAHLTNNSVAKKNKELYSQIYANSMLTRDQFIEYCQLQGGFQENKFHGQMHEIMVNAVESGRFNMLPRKKSFSVFGFDLMVDTDFNLWLIEVNSSPSMDTNTNVTEKIVPEFFESLCKAVVDYNFVGNSQFRVGDEVAQFKMIHKKKRL